MAKGNPSAVTLRIRAMAKVVRMEDKITTLTQAERERRVTFDCKIQALEDELRIASPVEEKEG